LRDKIEKKNKMISIVVPTRNAALTIGRCIESIATQNVEMEILLCDASSRDATIAVAEAYGRGMLRVVSRGDAGQADAIDKGMRAAKGRVVCWLCADDTLEPGALSLVAAAFGDPGLELFVGACRRTYQDGHVAVTAPHDDQFAKINLINYFDQPSVFWTQALYNRVGGLNKDLKLAFDWDLWNRFLHAKAHVSFTDKILSNYYFSADNKTSCNPELSRIEAAKVLAEYAPYGQATANLYNYIYREFDLKGMFDIQKNPPRRLREEYEAFIKHAVAILGKEIVYSYNWQWISNQARGMVWR
jgi:glycosyltransferase involved in cell wall biosynthesis